MNYRLILLCALGGCSAAPAIAPSRPAAFASVAPTAPLPAPPATKALPTASDPVIEKLVARARELEPLVESEWVREWLRAASTLPSVPERVVHHDASREHYYSAKEYDALGAAEREGLVAERGGTALYYETHYGTPLAYARPLDLAARAGLTELRGRRVLDFGCGGVGQLRLLAAVGARAVGIDVDPFLGAFFSEPSDLGPFPRAGDPVSGSVDLVLGRFPSEIRVSERVGSGYSLVVSKNTLKNGYVHPAEPVPSRQKFVLGTSDEAFVRAFAGILDPGGFVIVYNLGPPPAPSGEKYRPHADVRTPFPRPTWEAAGFEILAFDEDDLPHMQRMAKIFGWDSEMGMNLETDLFVRYTLARRR